MSESQPTILGRERRATVIQRIGHHLASFFGLGDNRETPSPPSARREDFGHGGDAPTGPILRIVAPEPEPVARPASFRWRRHPQLLAKPASDLAPDEREARHEAVRGLFAARAGAFACAETHFAEAARCEAIDLTAIPGFWQLDRRAMMAAVHAYESAGRIRDGSALNALVRSMYRPRVLTAFPENVTHMPQLAEKATKSI